MAKNRSHSVEFKRQVAQEFLAGETLHGLAKRHDAFGVQTLRDLPDIEALEDAGLLSRRFTPAEALGNKEVADGE